MMKVASCKVPIWVWVRRMRPDGSIEIHEAKGFWEDDARVKIKAVAEQFPEFWFMAVQWKGGEWQVERFRAMGAAS